MNQKRILETPDAPAAVGHYSQGTTNGQVVFTSGQIALQSDGESITDESITVQTRQCLDNVMAILEEAGANPETILKMKIFLTDVEMYEK